MDDDAIFMIGGFIDSPKSFNGAIGVYDYFWSLEPDLRVRLIDSWQKSLDLLKKNHEDMTVHIMDSDDFGNLALFTDGEAVEVKKPKDNVVQFPVK